MLRPHGGYRNLRSFQTAEIIFDATIAFCDRFVNPRSRTVDQMVQSARSGRQNIAEGSRAAATSGETEIRLVNVARSSLDELLLDYEDYLRHRNLPQWDKDSPQALAVRAVGKGQAPDIRSYAPWLQHTDPAVIANCLICLIHQANYLLDNQVRSLEQRFIQEGGYREQLGAARREERRKQAASDRPERSDPTVPACPRCGQPMVRRTAKTGPRAGSQFWGCSKFPDCKGTRAVVESDRSDGSVRSD
jgi:four helix bundle suffix protein